MCSYTDDDQFGFVSRCLKYLILCVNALLLLLNVSFLFAVGKFVLELELEAYECMWVYGHVRLDR